MVARLNGVQEAAGSTPVTRTKQIRLESVNFRVFFAFTGMFCPEKLLNLHLAFLLKNGLVCNMSVIAQHVFLQSIGYFAQISIIYVLIIP